MVPEYRSASSRADNFTGYHIYLFIRDEKEQGKSLQAGYCTGHTHPFTGSCIHLYLLWIFIEIWDSTFCSVVYNKSIWHYGNIPILQNPHTMKLLED